MSKKTTKKAKHRRSTSASKKLLSQMLNEVDKLFPSAPAFPGLQIFNYSIGKFPSGWRFTVTNDWHKWHDAELTTDFGLYSTPEDAVAAFLLYVRENGIDVMALCHRPNAAVKPRGPEL